MTEIKFTCAADHAIHFDRDYLYAIGHLESFKIGTDVTLTKDLLVMEPINQRMVSVAGLLTIIDWGGDPEDVMTISALVSSSNRQQIMNVVHKGVASVISKAKFVIYDYDDEAKKWFKTFHTNDAEISGNVVKKDKVITGSTESRTKLELSVAAASAKHEDGHDFSPVLWEMTAKIDPGKTVQQVHFLTSALHKIVKDWGTTT